ncbi:MAG: CDP-diacylglycerol--glycerol-3-phosphate 3-phosphatidyltransferase [Thermodesulfobacteriota bacterium]
MFNQFASRASLTLPNLITLVRILLTPLFIILLIQGRYRQALLIFLLAGVTDLADGLIARHWQQKTPLGTILDPLADKLLLSSSFVTLSIVHLVPPWLTVLVISRDVALALGVSVLKLADYPLTIKPSLMGKWTTTWQLATVLVVLLGKIWPIPPPWLKACFWLTGGLTIVSGVQYLFNGLKMVGQNSGKHH